MNDALLTIEKLYAENRETINSIKQKMRSLEELQRNSTHPLKKLIFKGIHKGYETLLEEAQTDEVEIIDRVPLDDLIENSL